MTDEPENLTLRMLRKIDSRLDAIGNDMRDIKFRIGQLETGLSHVATGLSHLSIRMDRVEDRLERIEKRLDLVDA